jgi:hypothetical protein
MNQTRKQDTAPKNAYADDAHLSNPEFTAAGERLLSACKFYWQDKNGYDKEPPRSILNAMAEEVLRRVDQSTL